MSSDTEAGRTTDAAPRRRKGYTPPKGQPTPTRAETRPQPDRLSKRSWMVQWGVVIVVALVILGLVFVFGSGTGGNGSGGLHTGF